MRRRHPVLRTISVVVVTAAVTLVLTAGTVAVLFSVRAIPMNGGFMLLSKERTAECDGNNGCVVLSGRELHLTLRLYIEQFGTTSRSGPGI